MHLVLKNKFLKKKKKKKKLSSSPLLSNIDETKNKEYSKEIGTIRKSCLPWFLICDNP